MAHYVATRVIAAPIEAVFAYRLNLYNLPAYNPEVRDIRLLRKAPGNVGSVYAFRVRLAPLLWSRASLTVAVVDPPKRLEFQIASFIDAREVCTFARIERNHAEAIEVSFDCTVDTPGGVFAPMLDAIFVVPTLRRQARRELERMAAQLERQSHP